MSTKNNNWCARKCGWMSSSRARTDSLNDRICPLPSSNLKVSLRIFTWRLLRIRAWTFLTAFLTWSMTLLLTIFWMLRLLHIFHVGTFLLFLFFIIRPIPLIWPVFFWVIRLVITFHNIWLNGSFNYKLEI